MEVKLIIQSTPNPNALKFVLNTPVKTEGNVTYKSADECEDNLLAGLLFAVSSAIKEVYFFDNYITVSQDGAEDWEDIEDTVQKTIMDNIEHHDPSFKVNISDSAPKIAVQSSPEMDKIDAILSETVRPALQMDGGDIQLINYEDNILKIFYQGACGSCPSATMGTLQAIENILKNQFDPEIRVEMADIY